MMSFISTSSRGMHTIDWSRSRTKKMISTLLSGKIPFQIRSRQRGWNTKSRWHETIHKKCTSDHGSSAWTAEGMAVRTWWPVRYRAWSEFRSDHIRESEIQSHWREWLWNTDYRKIERTWSSGDGCAWIHNLAGQHAFIQAGHMVGKAMRQGEHHRE